MKGLNELLGRLRSSLGKDVETRESVAALIKETLNFDVRLADISIKGDILRIKTSPPKKNAIKLEEEKILRLVRERTGLNIRSILY